MLEHANWTLLLTGITRSFTHQLVRHRAGMSFSQLSQQYHEETDTHFVVPPSLSNDPKLLKTWTDAVESSRRAYRSILGSLLTNNNQSKEAKRAILSAARSVLPNATETKIVVTANARAIRHFLQLRGAIEGDVEMRQVSKLLYDVIMRDAPALVPDFECTILQDGSHMIKKIDPQRKSG